MHPERQMIYGFHAVNALLTRHPQRITAIRLDDKRHDVRMQELLQRAKEKNIKIEFATRAELDALINAQHQGVIALVKSQPLFQEVEDFLITLNHAPFLLILDGVQDPHNLGACLRSANAAGVDAVIAPKDRAVGVTNVVEKVASGATSFTPFIQVTNLARTLKTLKEHGIWLYGTSEHAQSLYYETDLRGPIAIIMGSEGKGLRRLTQEQCDFLIRIPMLGTVQSLNVSVATGICLFEVVRQNYEKK